MTLVTWFVAFALAVAGSWLAPGIPHPHVPKAIVAAGAGGKVTVQWFTVPFNAEHLAKLDDGFEWHLGFASLTNEVPLLAGDVAIPAARWKLDVLRGAGADDWSVLLTPFELWQSRRTARDNPAVAEEIARLTKDLAERGVPERVVVPSVAFASDDAEHLAMELLLAGYTARARFSAEPAGGMDFALRLHFGTLHRSAAFTEVFEARPLDTTGETKR